MSGLIARVPSNLFAASVLFAEVACARSGTRLSARSRSGLGLAAGLIFLLLILAFSQERTDE